MGGGRCAADRWERSELWDELVRGWYMWVALTD